MTVLVAAALSDWTREVIEKSSSYLGDCCCVAVGLQSR